MDGQPPLTIDGLQPGQWRIRVSDPEARPGDLLTCAKRDLLTCTYRSLEKALWSACKSELKHNRITHLSVTQRQVRERERDGGREGGWGWVLGGGNGGGERDRERQTGRQSELKYNRITHLSVTVGYSGAGL